MSVSPEMMFRVRSRLPYMDRYLWSLGQKHLPPFCRSWRPNSRPFSHLPFLLFFLSQRFKRLTHIPPCRKPARAFWRMERW
eukprot:857831-Rhodomonas_salina.2